MQANIPICGTKVQKYGMQMIDSISGQLNQVSAFQSRAPEHNNQLEHQKSTMVHGYHPLQEKLHHLLLS